jgi:hypothetical protein
VWTEKTYDGNNFHSFIKVYNLDTKETKTVAEVDSDHFSDVYKDNVAYVNKTNDKYNLLIKDISDGTTVKVGGSNFQGYMPTIYENNVVFVGSEDGNNWYIYKYNIDTKELSKVMSDAIPSGEAAPDLQKDLCVFDGPNNEIMLYNISSGEIKVLANDQGSHVKLENSRVVYRTGNPNPNVYLIDTNPQTPPVNHPPVIQDIPDSQVAYGTGWSHTPQVSDPDQGDTTNIQIVTGPFEIISGKVVLKAAYQNVPGIHEGKIRVTDSKGASAEDSFKVTVLPDNVPINHAPTLENIVGGEVDYGKGYLSPPIVASDPDNDPLTYQVTDSHFEIVKEGGNNIVKLKPEYATQPGDYHTAVKVTDSNGASAEKSVDITVKEKPVHTGTAGIPWSIVGGATALVASIFAAFALLGRKKEKEVRYYPPQPVHRNGRKPANGNGGY